MSVDRFRRAESIFQDSLKTHPGERAEFVHGMCEGDERLEQEVLQLLEHHDEADGLLDKPVGEVRPAPVVRELKTEFGKFKILDVLGEGGMGIVYLADQTKPVRRRVAVKVIKIGIDSKRATARFESERQALALMNHPNIARVYEAGATPDGRLFFAMEYIPGLPINEYCDKYRLPIRKRVELYDDVCNAIQHAHEKGIIHRDIKPSNILVTADSKRATPKIIDFGVAKATNQRLVEHTIYTHQGLIVGSLEYMSPEQADCRVMDVDTRSDLYSMGAVLYELLTGGLPVDVSDVSRVGYTEIERRIQEDEPTAPSQKIRESVASAPEIAEQRGAELSSIAKDLRGELDWIVTKALEKDRLRRYHSASELAADLKRYLNHEPVLAGPPSASYRIRKFVRRHVALVAGASAVLAALALGLTTSTVLFVKSENQRQDLLRLSDVNRLATSVEEAKGLVPPHPEKIPEMEAWLAGDAADLASRIDHHKRNLEELERAGALVSASVGAAATTDTRTRSTYRFDDPEQQFHYDILSKLIQDLERFDDSDPSVGLIANVEERLGHARRVYRESVQAHATEWHEAIRAISDTSVCPVYDGLTIAAQVGLTPIGRDPESGLWEFAHLRTGSPPTRDTNGKLILTDETSVVLVLVPGDCFWMGAAQTAEGLGDSDLLPDRFARPDEGPVHQVCLDPFLISKYEITQAQWVRVIGKNPSRWRPDVKAAWNVGSWQQPVERVTWHLASSAMPLMGLDIPTEAQWEYAARAGVKTAYWTGADPSSGEGAGNLRDETRRLRNEYADPKVFHPWSDGYAQIAPVGQFRGNAFGLHDVLGNVWEWVRDYYVGYDTPVATGDGLRLADHADYRVVRGGAYDSQIERLARRVNFKSLQSERIGVRPSRRLHAADPAAQQSKNSR